MTRAQPTAVFLLLLVFVGQLSALSVRECWHEIFQRWALTPERRETFHRISSARVLVADYSLLRTDIPQLASLSRKQINSWLLENVAFISDKQLEGVGRVSTPIGMDGSQKRFAAVRPPGYYRAALFSARDPDKKEGEIILPTNQWKYAPWLDVKGVGSANVHAPQLRPYKTGLIALNKAFIDFVMQKVTHRLLEIENTNFSTVGTYAVIDLGFDILASKSPEMFQPFVDNLPAGLLVRRVSCRMRQSTNALHPALEVEFILRKYGFSSCHYDELNRSTPRCRLNVQVANDGDVTDFEAYNLAPIDMLLSPVTSWRRTDRFNISLFNTSEHLPDSNEATSPDDEIWGCPAFSGCRGGGRLLLNHLHNIATGFRRNELSQEEVEARIHDFVPRLRFMRNRNITRLINLEYFAIPSASPWPTSPPSALFTQDAVIPKHDMRWTDVAPRGTVALAIFCLLWAC